MYGGRGREGEQGSVGGGRGSTNQRQPEATEIAVERRRRLATGALSSSSLSLLFLLSLGRRIGEEEKTGGRRGEEAFCSSSRLVGPERSRGGASVGTSRGGPRVTKFAGEIRLFFYLNFTILIEFYQIQTDFDKIWLEIEGFSTM
jgi:hypothetical protein